MTSDERDNMFVDTYLARPQSGRCQYLPDLVTDGRKRPRARSDIVSNQSLQLAAVPLLQRVASGDNISNFITWEVEN
eukprot:2737343-Rhodomonas_salina.1